MRSVAKEVRPERSLIAVAWRRHGRRRRRRGGRLIVLAPEIGGAPALQVLSYCDGNDYPYSCNFAVPVDPCRASLETISRERGWGVKSLWVLNDVFKRGH